MTEGSYRRKTGRYWIEVREKALVELAELRAERDVKESELELLNQEIVRLEQAVSSLSPLASDGGHVFHVGVIVEGVADMSLAEACREILKQSTTYRTARGIRDSLRDSGYNLDLHSNPLASIHGVLKRFVEAGEVEHLETEGKSRYRWKTNVTATPETARLEPKGSAPDIHVGPTRPNAFKARFAKGLKKD